MWRKDTYIEGPTVAAPKLGWSETVLRRATRNGTAPRSQKQVQRMVHGLPAEGHTA